MNIAKRIELWPLDRLKPYERNARTHDGLMELDPKYCDVIVKRWQEFTGKSARLLDSGQTFDEVAGERFAANDNSEPEAIAV